MINVITIGFDIRVPRDGDASQWSEERRTKFLIRPDIQIPASVDRDVWPAVEGTGTERPLQLWSSVNEIRTAHPSVAWGSKSAPIIIKIDVLADEENSRYWSDIFLGYVLPEVDMALRISFQQIGYDIADRYLLSGLSNCMLSPEELAGVRAEWAQSINDAGLFSESGPASVFRSVCDRLIPEHAPFFVYPICVATISTTC